MRKEAHGIESIKTASSYVKRKEGRERRRGEWRKGGGTGRMKEEGRGRKEGKKEEIYVIGILPIDKIKS